MNVLILKLCVCVIIGKSSNKLLFSTLRADLDRKLNLVCILEKLKQQIPSTFLVIS